MFNININDLDKKIWEEELNDFVPKKVYDVHTHIYQWQSNLDINKSLCDLSDLTIIIPTYNRQNFLVRQIIYL